MSDEKNEVNQHERKRLELFEKITGINGGLFAILCYFLSFCFDKYNNLFLFRYIMICLLIICLSEILAGAALIVMYIVLKDGQMKYNTPGSKAYRFLFYLAEDLIAIIGLLLFVGCIVLLVNSSVIIP